MSRRVRLLGNCAPLSPRARELRLFVPSQIAPRLFSRKIAARLNRINRKNKISVRFGFDFGLD